MAGSRISATTGDYVFCHVIACISFIGKIILAPNQLDIVQLVNSDCVKF